MLGFLILSNGYCAAALAGAIGALGVALTGAIVQPRLRSPIALWGTGLAGLLGGLPFGIWLNDAPALQSQRSLLIGISFVVWQSAVGTCLFAACAKRKYTAALSHHDAERLLTSTSPYTIVDALDGVSQLDKDWEWVREWALRLKRHPNRDVRHMAQTALGRLTIPSPTGPAAPPR